MAPAPNLKQFRAREICNTTITIITVYLPFTEIYVINQLALVSITLNTETYSSIKSFYLLSNIAKNKLIRWNTIYTDHHRGFLCY